MGRKLRTVVKLLTFILILNTTGCTKLGSLVGTKSGTSSGVTSAKDKATRRQAAQPTKEIITSSGIPMISIPGGSFRMGGIDGNPDELPMHTVTLSPFLIDKFPVTGEMFAKVKMPNPSHWQDNPRLPVEQVHWREAIRYCNARSKAEGLKPCYNADSPETSCDFTANGYRLPTEAEWEYAAKSGLDDSYDFGNREYLRDYAWYGVNSGRRTHPVGEKRPNLWGIHDMYGNVSNWCHDVYEPNYYQNSPGKDPHGPISLEKNALRVVRGGNWRSSPSMSRASYRQGESPADGDFGFAVDYCGFRCVRRADADEISKLRTVSGR